jgi:hypothetical protein
MRNYWKLFLILSLFFATDKALEIHQNHEYCFPENNLHIPVSSNRNLAMSESVFNRVIDVAEDIYEPIIAQEGAKLEIERNWADGTVNAYAQQIGNVYKVSMFGGLARHSTVTPDGFAMVVCHEIGHHIGGAPKKTNWLGIGSWASNEGQADYWGANKCMKKVLEVLEDMSTDNSSDDYKYAKVECEKRYRDSSEQEACLRTSMGGKSLAELFKALRKQTKDLHFWTKDPAVVATTNHNHPDPQCRLDTYFSGSLCDKDSDAEVSDSNPATGFCYSDTVTNESRPLCWFKPKK